MNKDLLKPRQGDRFVEGFGTFKEAQDAERRYAEIIVRQGMQDQLGAFVARVQSGFGVYIGPHAV